MTEELSKRIALGLFTVAIAGIILAYALPVFAQTLQPVSSGLDLWPMLIGLIVIGVIVGIVIWHKRNPTAEVKALGEAHAAMTGIAGKAHDAIAELIAKVEPAKPSRNIGITVNVPAGTPEIDPDKLAAVEAARVAYENAKADAGIP